MDGGASRRSRAVGVLLLGGRQDDEGTANLRSLPEDTRRKMRVETQQKPTENEREQEGEQGQEKRRQIGSDTAARRMPGNRHGA